MEAQWVLVTIGANVALSWFMTGLIWLVQLVGYPLLSSVGSEEYSAYHSRHIRLITPLVTVIMPLELALSVALSFITLEKVPLWIIMLHLITLSIIWLSTVIFQLPCHARLRTQFDGSCHGKLVAANWIRTIAWSLKALLSLWIMQLYFS